jgi:hypothetical protein
VTERNPCFAGDIFEAEALFLACGTKPFTDRWKFGNFGLFVQSSPFVPPAFTVEGAPPAVNSHTATW